MALAIKSGDVAATTLKNDAQKQLDFLAAEAMKAKEQEQNYQTAMKEGRGAFSGKDYAKAKAQADVALGIRPRDPEATTLKNDAQKQLDLSASRTPLTNVFGVSNFDFIWIPNIRNGKGAYVEKTVLSRAQYNSLAGQYGLTPSKMPISGTTPDDPMNLAYEDAAQLINKLKTAAQQTKMQGQFQLPDRQDFLIFSEVKDSTGNSNPTYNTLAALFSHLGANTSGSQPRGVGSGNANQFGLFNVLGNAWEWCDDQSAAGFDCDTPFGTLFKNSQFGGSYTGVRLLFVPAQ